MVETNREYLMSLFGKLAYIYDTAVAYETTQDTWQAQLLDQAATGEPASIPFTDEISLYNSRWTSGVSAIATAVIDICKAILAMDETQAMFVSHKPASTSALDTLTALASELGADHDNVTMTTLASTGIVNFLNTVAGSVLPWNTEAGPGADYDDSEFCVLTIWVHA